VSADAVNWSDAWDAGASWRNTDEVSCVWCTVVHSVLCMWSIRTCTPGQKMPWLARAQDRWLVLHNPQLASISCCSGMCAL
jgi:hypothetical protein